MRIIIVLALLVAFAFANKVVPRSPNTEVACTLSGDPHMRTFSQQNFDEYAVGDFILAEWSNLVIGGRFNTVPQWGKQSTTRAVAVRFNGHKVTIHADTKEVKINDKVAKINLKATNKVNANLAVFRNSDNQYIIHAGTERVAVNLYGNAPNQWMDVVIFTSTAKVQSLKRGLCKDKFKVNFTGFNTPRKHYTPLPNPRRWPEAEAKQFCKPVEKISKMHFHFCVSDYIVGGKELAKHILITEQNKKKLRERYRKSKKCRKAEDKLKLMKNGAEKVQFSKFVARVCKPKKRSASCKRAQKFYASAAAKFNRTKAQKDVPTSVKNELQKLLTAFGAKVNAICQAQKLRKQCRTNRKLTITHLKKQLADLEARAKKIKSQIADQKKIKCQKPVPTLKKICLMV